MYLAATTGGGFLPLNLMLFHLLDSFSITFLLENWQGSGLALGGLTSSYTHLCWKINSKRSHLRQNRKFHSLLKCFKLNLKGLSIGLQWLDACYYMLSAVVHKNNGRNVPLLIGCSKADDIIWESLHQIYILRPSKWSTTVLHFQQQFLLKKRTIFIMHTL